MTMLEKVAAAIRDVEFKMPGAGGLKGTLYVSSGQSLDLARAAIEAMREPTEAMCNAFGITTIGYEATMGTYLDDFDSRGVWTAMVKAALEGEWRERYEQRRQAVGNEVREEFHAEGQKMKVRIYEVGKGQGTMFVLCSVEHPENSVVLSLPTEFTQEVFLERANLAFDTLARGLKTRYDLS